MERAGTKGMTGKVALVLVSLVVGVLVGWMMNTQTSKEADVGQQAVGPHHIEDGVPVGYAQTREGAIAAASNYERVRSGQLLLNEQAYLKAIERMASENWRSRGLASGREATKTAMTSFGPSATIESSPVKYLVRSFDKTQAEVDVWVVSVVEVGGGVPPKEIWSNVSYHLVWEADGWRIRDAKAAATVVPAPFSSPSAGGNESGLSGYQGYRYAPSN